MRHCGHSMAPRRSQPAPPSLSMNATAPSHRSSASQYSLAAFTSRRKVLSNSLRGNTPMWKAVSCHHVCLQRIVET